SSNPPKQKCSRTSEPVAILTGDVTQDEIDLTLPGLIPLVIAREYTSARRDKDGLLGFGWALSLDRAIERRGDVLAVELEGGREAACAPVGVADKWLHRRRRFELRGRDDGYDRHELDSRLTYRFRGGRERAWLASIEDAWGNRVTFEYQGARLTR